MSRAWAVAGVAAAVGLAWWLVAPFIEGYRLFMDDYAYLVSARAEGAPWSTAFRPHNAHVVPLFRLLTWGLLRLAGGLGGAPAALGAAAFAGLALTMLAAGHLVSRATGSAAAGVAATAGVGVTSVALPSATWYSAGQALWAGLFLLATLIGLEGWRSSGRRAWLAAAWLAAFLAPAVWSGGYVAGLAGGAYVAAGTPRRRDVALLSVFAPILYAILVFTSFGRSIIASSDLYQRKGTDRLAALRSVAYTAQAIPEVLVAGNLGLDARVEAAPGVALCLLMGVSWMRGGGRRPSGLEAAGLTTVVGSFVLVYAFRGYLPYASLRDLGWYHAIPQVGAVLFVAGWWGRARRDRRPRGWAGVALALGLSIALFALNKPRADRALEASAPACSPLESARFPTPDLRRLRAIYLRGEEAGRQRRALARLEKAGRAARRAGLSRADLRRAFGRVLPPGWPPQIRDDDAFDLLDLPVAGPDAPPGRAREAVGDLLVAEPEARPPWLDPDARWPPP